MMTMKLQMMRMVPILPSVMGARGMRLIGVV